MIESINFTVKFPPTDPYPQGRSFDRQINFQPGMTNIIGPNEAGKSLVIEMLEFLLFGSKALRGKAEDYGHLRAWGTVVIRGERVRIERTMKRAAINDGVVVGTKPVNAYIIRLLGYGLAVFRVANVANQGKSEWLAEMQPAARKAMVDKLVGADEVEAMSKWCGEQATGVAREIAGMRAWAMEPTKPEPPADYEASETLAGRVAALRALHDRALEIRAFLANPPAVMAEPVRPTDVPLDTLEKAAEVWSLPTYNYDPEEVAFQWAGWDRWQEKQEFGRRHPRPNLDLAVIEQQRLRVNLALDLVRLSESPKLTCPCGMSFTSADAEIARIQAEIAAIPVIEGIGKIDLDEELRRARDWAKPETDRSWQKLACAPPFDKPNHPREKPAAYAIHVDAQYDAIRELGINPDLTVADLKRMARELRTYDAEVAARQVQLTAHGLWTEKADVQRAELAGIDYTELPALGEKLDASRLYEGLMAAYEKALATYEAARIRLGVLATEEESWREGKAGLDALRQDTKNYILPALARVSSVRLQEMTGGMRGRVVVDEDFEIEVDGQALNTLSGSGKVCANLALRFGLGRILTNGVFPVFIGDEMDASMDDGRVQYLHDALLRMQDKLTQTIIITHKAPSCPNVVDLGE